ncbi:hypothetical protein HUJ04_012051 [Dendroctonus ponderosae]|nr:hypothetical protein HUJ04_012051 [Dendroctonus ponderosae]KAH1022693.1 hypothetical protein HUJ04_012051 [Dendroctonus ponderosae]KAH1022694.1 hypothetical protein HUJ04_012051 [Dendroctonus ponderosae]KAH1022695.1 hypothetical protein HUJ04_012051 [Dendroctonus ponderosae]KAH1029177.1 hypothetical protein HUJ05_002459 [Dendroctonus ponderosae]
MQVSPHIFPANRCPYICLHCTQFLKQTVPVARELQPSEEPRNPSKFPWLSGKRCHLCDVNQRVLLEVDPVQAEPGCPPLYVALQSGQQLGHILTLSRYSRRSVRQLSTPAGPRPILGTKAPFPRPILGRKENYWRTSKREEKNSKEKERSGR